MHFAILRKMIRVALAISSRGSPLRRRILSLRTLSSTCGQDRRQADNRTRCFSPRLFRQISGERAIDLVNRTTFILTGLLVLTASLGAQEYLEVSDVQKGPAFSYDQKSQYVRLSVKNLTLPSSTSDQNAAARFFRNLLQGRKTVFSLSTIEVDPKSQKASKVVLYSIEKSGNNFRIQSLSSGATIGYRITEEFVFDESFPVAVKVSRSEWEEREDILSQLAGSFGSLSPAPEIGIGVSEVFNIVSRFFPPKSTVIGMDAMLTPSDIENSELVIGSKQSGNFSGDPVELFRLEFEVVQGHFRDYSLQDGLRRAGLFDTVGPWRDLIRDADEQIRQNGGLGPLTSVIVSFSDFVANLPLTRYDRAILTACAVKNWAPNAYNGTELQSGGKVQFTANDYLRLSTGNLDAIKDSECNVFFEVQCNTDECRSMVDFLNKSARKNGRLKAAELYIDGSIIFSVDGIETELSRDEYIDKIRILRPARFEKRQAVENQWSFVFEPGSLSLQYDGQNYRDRRIIIDISRDLINGSQRFLVTSIEAK